jgi:hypothetical protein
MSLPHPEEPRSGVSKDEPPASWFETREGALRGSQYYCTEAERPTAAGGRGAPGMI